MSVPLFGEHRLDLGLALLVHLLQFGLQPRNFILFFLEDGELAFRGDLLLGCINTISLAQMQLQNSAWREAYLDRKSVV